MNSSLRGGVYWSLLSLIGGKALTFLATLILARLLAPSEFGVLAAVLAFILVLEVISDVGLKASVIYESERGITSRVQTAFTLNLIFTLLLTALAVALAPLIADFFGASDETGLFRLAAVDLLLVGLGNIHDALLQRDLDFRRRLVPQLTGSLVRGVATIALAVAGLGASALVIGFIVGTAAMTATLWLVQPFRPNLTIERGAIRPMTTYGGWASALEILTAVAQRADVAVVGSALGARALGLYTIAQRVPELIVGNVTWSLSIVAFPALSQRREREDDSLKETTLNLIRYSALFGMSTGAALAVLAPALLVVLFTDKWAEASGVMEALAVMYGLICIVFPLGDTFKALGKQPIMVAVNAVSVPIAIGAMLLAVPSGIVAVAWARTLVTLAHGVVFLILITNVLDLRLVAVARMLRPACAAAAGITLAGLAVRNALPEPTIGPLVVGSLACAIGGLFAMRLFAREELGELLELVRNGLPSTPLVPTRWRSRPPIASIEVGDSAEATPESESGTGTRRT